MTSSAAKDFAEAVNDHFRKTRGKFYHTNTLANEFTIKPTPSIEPGTFALTIRCKPCIERGGGENGFMYWWWVNEDELYDWVHRPGSFPPCKHCASRVED